MTSEEGCGGLGSGAVSVGSGVCVLWKTCVRLRERTSETSLFVRKMANVSSPPRDPCGFCQRYVWTVCFNFERGR